MFKTIHDLGNLSEADRTKYLADVSVHFGVSPELNLFDLIWMPSGDGIRKLIVYARRGTTDILRDIHKINVTSMRSEENGKTIKFIVSGKNKDGREEWASGSHSVEGLKGKQLEAAEMTSQTRALRRLTLQFVGGGILDVAEIDEKTSDINNSPASLAQLSGAMPPVFIPPQTPPVTAPNIEPGKVVEVTEKQLKEIVTNAHEIAKKFLDKSVSTDVTISTNTENVQSSEIVPINTNRKPRGRKRKNTVDLSSPGQIPAPTPVPQQLEIPAGVIDKNGKISEPTATANLKEVANGNGIILQPPSTETKPSNADISESQRTPTSVPTQAIPVVSVQVEPAVAPEKLKIYRERLTKYISDILPREGKMMPSEGIGGTPNKLRKFAQIFNNIENIKKMNEEQWEGFLGFLDSYYQSKGAVELTNYINASIGAK